MREGVGVGDLVSGLQQRGSRLPFEIGAFVALEACEDLLECSVRLDTNDVRVTSEGQVVVADGVSEARPSEAAASLVALLQTLLGAAGPDVPPGLKRLIEGRSSSHDLGRLRDEIRASLIPLNRGASRRVLARLVRDASRAMLGVPTVSARQADAELDEFLERGFDGKRLRTRAPRKDAASAPAAEPKSKPSPTKHTASDDRSQTKSANAPKSAPAEPEVSPQVAQSTSEASPQVAPSELEASPQVVLSEPEASPQVARSEPEASPQVASSEPEVSSKVAQSTSEASPQVVQSEPEVLPDVVQCTLDDLPQLAPSESGVSSDPARGVETASIEETASQSSTAAALIEETAPQPSTPTTASIDSTALIDKTAPQSAIATEETAPPTTDTVEEAEPPTATLASPKKPLRVEVDAQRPVGRASAAPEPPMPVQVTPLQVVPHDPLSAEAQDYQRVAEDAAVAEEDPQAVLSRSLRPASRSTSLIAAAILLTALLSWWLGRESFRPVSPTTVAEPTSSRGVIELSVTPGDAQVLQFVGRGPASIGQLAVGEAHEFVALEEGYKPTRVMVPAQRPWERATDGLLYELAIQLPANDNADATLSLGLPLGTEAPAPGDGRVRVVTNPPEAKVYRFMGRGPTVSLDGASVARGHEFLIYRAGFAPYRAVIGPSDWKDITSETPRVQLEIVLQRR